MRGRLQVGKSTMLTEWLERELPSAPSFRAGRPADCHDALALLAATHDLGASSIVVLDEFLYLGAGIPASRPPCGSSGTGA
ncbi:MAG: hypothetical protein ACRD0K_18450 [Egibacteraceae bacterium]